jgi:hypothetical protein
MTSHDPQPRFERREFTYTLTPEEVERLGKPLKARKLMGRVWLACIVVAIVLAAFAAATAFAWNNPLGFIPALMLTAWGIQIVWVFAEQAEARRARKPYGDGAPFHVVLDENGIVEQRPAKTVLVSWHQIADIQIAHDLLLFARSGRQSIFLPLRCLDAGTSSASLLQAVREAKAHAQNTVSVPGIASLSGPRVSFISDQKNVERLYRHYLRHASRAAMRREAGMLALYLLIMLAFLCHFLTLLKGSQWFSYLLLGGIVLTLAISPRTSARTATLNALKKTPGMLGPMTVALSAKEVELIHAGGASLTSWENVAGVKQDKKTIYIRFSENALIAIPRAAFPAQPEADAFYAAAVLYWTAVQTGETIAEPPDSVWPPAPKKV